MSNNQEMKYTLSLKDLFSKKMGGAIGATSRLDSKMNSLDKSVNKIGNRLGGALSIAAVANFGGAVVDSLKNYEYFSASLRTLLHGDRDAAGLLNSQLTELAKTTPFSLVDVQDSSKKLLAYGFAAKDVVNQMRILGDVSAATGNGISEVAYLYGTLKTQGRAMTKDLYQFTNRGINVIPLLAKQFGILESEVYSFAEQGKIGFRDIEKAFTTMTSKGGDFFNMMNEQSKTVGGKISNLGDSWEQLKITIGNSLSGFLNDSVTWATKMVNALNSMWNNEDKISASFNKYGAKDYSGMEKFNKMIGMGAIGKGDYFTGGSSGDLRYQDAINKQFVDPASGGISEAMKSQLSLSNIITNMYQDKEARKDMTSFNRTIAILKGSLDEVKSKIAVFKGQGMNSMNKNSLDENGEPLTGKTDGATQSGGMEIVGARPQSINISINKLIETQNINTTNLKEGSSTIREEVSKALLEAVNDVNQIAR